MNTPNGRKHRVLLFPQHVAVFYTNSKTFVEAPRPQRPSFIPPLLSTRSRASQAQAGWPHERKYRLEDYSTRTIGFQFWNVMEPGPFCAENVLVGCLKQFP